MFSTKWRRPSDVEYPKVWHKFERTTKDGKVLKFKVQDLTEDLYEETIEFMGKYYIPHETWNISTGVSTDPVAIELFGKYILESTFPQKVQLVCLLDEDDVSKDEKKTIVGCNILGICSNEEKENFDEFLISQSIINLLTSYQILKENSPNLYEKYNVNLIMNSLGLCVHPDFRGMGISPEILATRFPLCKAVGIPVTASFFTSIISQRAAAKAGYTEDSAYSYENLSKDTGIEFKTVSKYTKMMSKLIE